MRVSTPANGPIEPPRTGVRFPDPRAADEHGIVALGSDFRPGTLLEAYRHGIFPWPHENVVPWFSPDPRAVFPLDVEPHWSRSLRRTLRRHPFRVTVDAAFAETMTACGATREATWITPELHAAYERLFELGWAHSVEVWDASELVGGIYGIAVRGLFAGESMFHRRTDASKIAFASLVQRMRAGGYVLFDVQIMTDHLASLGCIEMPRDEYLARLEDALRVDARIGP